MAKVKTPQIALANLARAGLVGHPDSVRKHMGNMLAAMKKALEDGREVDIIGFCESLEEEIARFERQKSSVWKADGPTPETARKVKSDPIRMLLDRGTIDKDDEDAIEEIREIRYKLSCGLSTGGMDLKGERVDTSRKSFTHPAERMTERQAQILKHVYRPWADDQNAERILVGKRRRPIQLTPFGLTCSVIEGEATLRGLEQEHRLNQSGGELATALRVALGDFSNRLSKATSEGKVPRRKK